MSEQTVTLKILGDNGHVIAVLAATKAAINDLGNMGKASGEKIDRGMDAGEKGLNEVGAAAAAAARKMEEVGTASDKAATKAKKNYRSTRAGLQSISSMLMRTRRELLGFIGLHTAMSAARGLAQAADQWAQVSGRLRLATQGAVETGQAMGRVYEVAQRTSTGMDTTAGLVAKITGNLRDMGMESQAAFGKALGLAETINKTFIISGASAAAQGNAIQQFTQALAGGVLRAEEFNSVVENSDRLARLLAEGMKVNLGELRRAVNEGKVSAEEMLTAIQSQASAIDAEFAQMPKTIGNAWVELQNAVLRYVGTADQAYSASARVAEAIAWLARNVDLVASLSQRQREQMQNPQRLPAPGLSLFRVGLPSRRLCSGEINHETLAKCRRCPLKLAEGWIGVRALKTLRRWPRGFERSRHIGQRFLLHLTVLANKNRNLHGRGRLNPDAALHLGRLREGFAVFQTLLKAKRKHLCRIEQRLVTGVAFGNGLRDIREGHSKAAFRLRLKHRSVTNRAHLNFTPDNFSMLFKVPIFKSFAP